MIVGGDTENLHASPNFTLENRVDKRSDRGALDDYDKPAKNQHDQKNEDQPLGLAMQDELREFRQKAHMRNSRAQNCFRSASTGRSEDYVSRQYEAPACYRNPS